jgi:cephalosporin hydroxylase
MDDNNRRVFTYRKIRLPNDYLASLETGVFDIETARKRTGQSIGYPGWNLLYYTLFCALDIHGENFIIETGSNWGCSTIILAQALKDSGLRGHVHSVEIDPENARKARSNLKMAKLSCYATVTCEDSISFLQRLTTEIDQIRFAFLDGCHDESHVLKEFSLVVPKLADKGLVFFDNIAKVSSDKSNQRVFGALKKIKRKFGGNLIRFENVSWSTPGQAIWQK